ncbi:hypothetical protein [Streptomyces sp. NPDC055749]
MTALSQIRVVRCITPSVVARDRIVRRAEDPAYRAAHADQELLDAIASGRFSYTKFKPISLDMPTLTVNTSNGYRPSLDDIKAFLRGTAQLTAD